MSSFESVGEAEVLSCGADSSIVVCKVVAVVVQQHEQQVHPQ